MGRSFLWARDVPPEECNCLEPSPHFLKIKQRRLNPKKSRMDTTPWALTNFVLGCFLNPFISPKLPRYINKSFFLYRAHGSPHPSPLWWYTMLLGSSPHWEIFKAMLTSLLLTPGRSKFLGSASRSPRATVGLPVISVDAPCMQHLCMPLLLWFCLVAICSSWVHDQAFRTERGSSLGILFC